MTGRPRSSANRGRPDAKGRSSGKVTGRDRSLHRPPQGESWLWQTVELIASPAWRSMSIHCRRFIDFLVVEHRSHAARENGNLHAPYDQLEKWGIGRRFIRDAILEAEFLGLIRYERGGRWAMTNAPSTYRLTFYTSHDERPPTNDWKGKTQEAITVWREDRARQRRAKRIKGPRVVAIKGHRVS